MNEEKFEKKCLTCGGECDGVRTIQGEGMIACGTECFLKQVQIQKSFLKMHLLRLENLKKNMLSKNKV